MRYRVIARADRLSTQAPLERTEVTTTTVSAGHTSHGLTIGNGDTLSVNAGGAANDITIVGGNEDVSGTASGTTISGEQNWGEHDQGEHDGGGHDGGGDNQGGSQTVFAGGAVTAITIDANGVQSVSAGGSAVNDVVSSGGTVIAEAGRSSGQRIVNIDGTTPAGTTLCLDAGTYSVEYVASGFAGRAEYDGFALTGAYGGGTPARFTDELSITRGSATNLAGAATYNDVVGGNQQDFTTGAAALDGYLNALASGSLTQTQGANTLAGSPVGAISFTLVSNGQVTFTAPDVFYPDNAGGISLLLTPIGQGGGTTTGTSLDAGGAELVSAGAVASHTTVSGGATQTLLTGGRAIDTVVLNGGTETLAAGGETFSTTVSGGGQQLVLSGATAIDTSLLGAGAAQTVGGRSIGTKVGGGSEIVAPGGFAIDTVVFNGGSEAVAAGGMTNSTTVRDGGIEAVRSGGTASNTTIDSLGVMNLGVGARTTGGIDFTGISGTLVVSATTVPSTPIGGFITGDTIDLMGLGFVSGGTDTVSGGHLAVTEGGTTDVLNITGVDGETVTISDDGHGGTKIVAITCFRPGTLITTPGGEVAVETLAAGDLVSTHDGAAMPVRWLGVQTVARRFADPLRVLPIRIAAGALGANLPVRDLLVSPAHALLVDGVLAQAGALVNGTSIVRVTDMPETFQYFHIELDRHALVLAEGLPAESYLDTVETGAFDNIAARPAGPVPTALDLPRVKSARQLPAKLRQRLAPAMEMAMAA